MIQNLLCILFSVILGVMTTIGVAWYIALEPPQWDIQTVRMGELENEKNTCHFYMFSNSNSVKIVRTVFSGNVSGVDQNKNVDAGKNLPHWSSTLQMATDVGDFYAEEEEFGFGWPHLALTTEYNLTHLQITESVISSANSNFNIVNGNVVQTHYNAGCTGTLRTALDEPRVLYKLPKNNGIRNGLLISEINSLNDIQSEIQILPSGPIFPGFYLNSLYFGLAWFALLWPLTIGRRLLRKKVGQCPKCAYDIASGHISGCPECGWNRI